VAGNEIRIEALANGDENAGIDGIEVNPVELTLNGQ